MPDWVDPSGIAVGEAPTHPPTGPTTPGARVSSIEATLDRIAAVLQRPSVAVAVVAVVLLSVLTYRPPVDPDVFHRVAVGRLIESNGAVVHQDPFAFTPRRDRWIDHEWLSGVVLYEASRLGGDLGLLALDMAMMLLTLALVVRAAAEQDDGRKVNLAWLLLVVAPTFGIWVSVVRSQVFTFALFAWMLLMLVRWRHRGVAWIWCVPPAFLLWANFHGGFVAGLGLLATAALAVTTSERRLARPLWTCVGIATLLTLINPYGLAYWGYILDAVTMERPGIVEWQGLSVLSFRGTVALVLAAVFVAGGLLGERRPPPEAWALAGVALAAAISAQRHVNFFLLILAVYGGAAAATAGRRLVAWGPRYGAALRRVATLGAIVMVPVLLGVAYRHVADVVEEGLNYDRLPVGAVEWLDRHGDGGRLLVHFNHGSLALWRLYPRYLVSVDGRYEETYPQSTVDLTYRAIDPSRPGHEAALREMAPDYILLPDASRASYFDPPWMRVFDDGRFAVLARHRRELSEPRPGRSMWTPGF